MNNCDDEEMEECPCVGAETLEERQIRKGREKSDLFKNKRRKKAPPWMRKKRR